MSKEVFLLELRSLADRPWETSKQIRHSLETLRNCTRSDDALTGLAASAVAFILREVCAYADSTEEMIEKTIGQSARAELERLREALKPAIYDLHFAVQSQETSRLPDSLQLLIQAWDGFEEEDFACLHKKRTTQ